MTEVLIVNMLLLVLGGMVFDKKGFLKLLEEDEEFRLAVAAKIGLLEILNKLEEHDKKFNEILERLDRHEEEIKKIWEELRRHREILDRHTRMIGALGNDIGALTEATLSRFMCDDLVDEIKLKGEKITMIKRMHVINGYEVDLYIETDKTIYVVEVKTRPSIEDIKKLIRVKEYLAEKTCKNIKTILMTLRAKTTLDIVSEARKNEIELIPY